MADVTLQTAMGLNILGKLMEAGALTPKGVEALAPTIKAELDTQGLDAQAQSAFMEHVSSTVSSQAALHERAATGSDQAHFGKAAFELGQAHEAEAAPAKVRTAGENIDVCPGQEATEISDHGVELLKANQPLAAISCFMEVLSKDPENISTLNRMAVAAKRIPADIQKEIGILSSREYLQLALSVDPAFAPALYNVAVDELSRGNVDNTLLVLEKILGGEKGEFFRTSMIPKDHDLDALRDPSQRLKQEEKATEPTAEQRERFTKLLAGPAPAPATDGGLQVLKAPPAAEAT